MLCQQKKDDERGEQLAVQKEGAYFREKEPSIARNTIA
jgi:hypothetical protein